MFIEQLDGNGQNYPLVSLSALSIPGLWREQKLPAPIHNQRGSMEAPKAARPKKT
jgi:hypothetical protein